MEDDIFTDDDRELMSEAERAEIAAELRMLEELGMGADGTPMTLADEAWDGGQWEPEGNDA